MWVLVTVSLSLESIMPRQRERNAIQSVDTRIALPAFQRYAIRLAFDGTTYQGFQAQPYKNTIQDQIEHRLRGLLKRQVRITAWGRTDSGVHAKGAVVSVDLSNDEVTTFAKRYSKSVEESETMNEVDAAARFLQSVLREFACNSGDTAQPHTRYGSIVATNITPVPSDFDARYSSKWKRYVYYIIGGDGDQSLPFAYTRFAWQIRQSLDLSAMIRAAELINKKVHNFEWMSITQSGERRNPLRTVKLSVEQVPLHTNGDSVPYFLQQSSENTALYKITGTCDFFLYKMMRRIVGILAAIGKRDASIDVLRACLEDYDNDSKTTKMKIPNKLLETAPAKGLCLDHIEYDIPI